MPDTLSHIPEPKRALLEQLVARLTPIRGLSAIVLGGSYAAGTHHKASDLDIGLYYNEADPFSLDEIRAVADEISTEGPVSVTGFYGWGAWVNGGAWIHTAYGKVDFIYRNIEQVRRTIAEAQQGITHHDYDQQPAYGFYSVMYLTETQICIPLYDPAGVIAELKRSVQLYPPELKRRVIADSLWSAEFTLLHARAFAAQGDVYNTAGCLTRAAANLTQALFALNETYFLRDKQVMQTLSNFPILPEGYVDQVNRILARPGSTPQQLMDSVSGMHTIWQSVVALSEGYQPQFKL